MEKTPHLPETIDRIKPNETSHTQQQLLLFSKILSSFFAHFLGASVQFEHTIYESSFIEGQFYKRELFLQSILETVKKALTNGSSVQLVVFDCIGVKTLNNTFDSQGHGGRNLGDAYISTMAQTLLKVVDDPVIFPPGSVAAVGRLGGDEFGILTVNLSKYQQDYALNQIITESRKVKFPFMVNSKSSHIQQPIVEFRAGGLRSSGFESIISKETAENSDQILLGLELGLLPGEVGKKGHGKIIHWDVPRIYHSISSTIKGFLESKIVIFSSVITFSEIFESSKEIADDLGCLFPRAKDFELAKSVENKGFFGIPIHRIIDTKKISDWEKQHGFVFVISPAMPKANNEFDAQALDIKKVLLLLKVVETLHSLFQLPKYNYLWTKFKVEIVAEQFRYYLAFIPRSSIVDPVDAIILSSLFRHAMTQGAVHLDPVLGPDFVTNHVLISLIPQFSLLKPIDNAMLGITREPVHKPHPWNFAMLEVVGYTLAKVFSNHLFPSKPITHFMDEVEIMETFYEYWSLFIFQYNNIKSLTSTQYFNHQTRGESRFKLFQLMISVIQDSMLPQLQSFLDNYYKIDKVDDSHSTSPVIQLLLELGLGYSEIVSLKRFLQDNGNDLLCNSIRNVENFNSLY